MFTKERIGPAIAIVAAIVGLVLVFAGHGTRSEAPSPPAPSGQVQPTAPGPGHPTTPPADTDDD